MCKMWETYIGGQLRDSHKSVYQSSQSVGYRFAHVPSSKKVIQHDPFEKKIACRLILRSVRAGIDAVVVVRRYLSRCPSRWASQDCQETIDF